MKFFIISSYKHADAYRELRDALQADGHAITHDWLEATDGKKGFDGTEFGTAEMQYNLRKDIAGIVNADIVAMLLPAGKDSCVEFGLALAFAKPIVLVPSTNITEYVTPETAFSYMHSKNVYRVKCAEFGTASDLALEINGYHNFHYYGEY